MTSEELEIHHKIARKALEEIDKIFRDNNIEYFLIEGSALGAVRHNDIIPWDDDIDIGVFLKDKDRAYKLIEEGISSEFRWNDRSINEDHPRFFGKITHKERGCIDVFVLIKTSNNSFGRRIHWIERKIFNKLYKAKLNYANSIEKRNMIEMGKVLFAKIISYPFSKSYIVNRMKRIEYRYECLSNNCYYVNLYGSYPLKRELIKTKWIGKGKKTKFGDGLYPVFANSHEYLKNLYGDYMIPPPENMRVLRHDETF